MFIILFKKYAISKRILNKIEIFCRSQIYQQIIPKNCTFFIMCLFSQNLVFIFFKHLKLTNSFEISFVYSFRCLQ